MTTISADYARISVEAGNSFYEIAQVKAEGREDNLLLAIEAYRRALSFYTLKRFPTDYAMTQNNLGIAYGGLADVREKEANLGLAVAAYQEALKVRTLAAFPTDYGGTSLNLGRAYLRLAELAAGGKRATTLAQAEAALAESVRAFEQEKLPSWREAAREALAQARRLKG
ncbi:MAG: hypothetical protein HY684_06560 [Chloroflexi bacterium]|nr:hypothetical protein [Chloroflexota bacterium]